MANADRMKRAIQAMIKTMMDRVMKKVLVEDPFIEEVHHAGRPLYAALVPDEIFKGAHFERRFVTPFGRAWERLAEVAANESGNRAVLGHTIQGTVKSERLRRIQEVLDRLEHSPRGRERVRPNWQQELDYIREGGGEPIPVTVICDLFVEDVANDRRLAFEIKAPLPNSDQTKVSKEKLLKLCSMEPAEVEGAYFALPYNPYGRREDYAWSFPARWFNMKDDTAVLMGDEFWDTIGGLGTYRAFIEAVNEIGAAYRDRIYREFLEMEPPSRGEVKL